MEAEHIPAGITVPMTPDRAGSILRGYLDGDDGGPELRAALRSYVDQHVQLEADHEHATAAWNDLIAMLREASNQALARSELHYESWHPDPQVMGKLTGCGLTWCQVNAMLVVIVNGAYLRRAAAREGSE
jgi:hypothetical protein